MAARDARATDPGPERGQSLREKSQSSLTKRPSLRLVTQPPWQKSQSRCSEVAMATQHDAWPTSSAQRHCRKCRSSHVVPLAIVHGDVQDDPLSSSSRQVPDRVIECRVECQHFPFDVAADVLSHLDEGVLATLQADLPKTSRGVCVQGLGAAGKQAVGPCKLPARRGPAHVARRGPLGRRQQRPEDPAERRADPRATALVPPRVIGPRVASPEARRGAHAGTALVPPRRIL
mmetsp:Transcript_161787/g.518976  ORF Transcript_161787/g.518976 Transcript_161787/m.518976 type:complete len:232 (-) Transcript_161787:206-901(-)